MYQDLPFFTVVLRIFFGLVLVLTGLLNLLGIDPTPWVFETVGHGAALRTLAGLLQIAAGVLLVVPVPGLALPGAVLAVAVMLGLLLARLWGQYAPMAIVSAVWFVVALLALRGALPRRGEEL